MRLPMAWLREFVDLPEDSDTVADKLATLGFPVEAIERRPPISGVVVGRIAEMTKHPNADRLQVCKVDVGGAALLTIATAATNVAQGQVVPVATIGAQLPHLKIERRAMRGVESEGMMCSADELGLEPEWFEDGILQLEPDAPLGADVVASYGLDGDVLDVEITSNRVDAMSVLGMARELAASYGRTLRMPATEYVAHGDSTDVSVSLETPDCRRYVAQRISNVSVRPGPMSLRARLALAGQRPINNLVDISNYVMLEVGQPLHFFDFERLAERRIVVRDARPGERLRTIDGEERELQPSALVIADAAEAQGLAGLKGGATSEVGDATRELVVESATFNGPRIRRMSVAFGLRTEASSRHEKGLPLALGDLGAARAAVLLAAQGAKVHAPQAVGELPKTPATVDVKARDIPRLLGFRIEPDEVVRSLSALGFAVRAGENYTYLVTPPPWRNDVTIGADAIEELARMAGYDRIVATLPQIFEPSLDSDEFERERSVASTLRSLGYREAVTFSLQPGGLQERYRAAGVELPLEPVEIANPLSEDQRFMRFSLLPGLLHIAARQTTRPLRLFEIGHAFGNGTELVELAKASWFEIADSRPGPDWHDAAFLAFKGDAEELLRSLCGRTPVVEATGAPQWHPGRCAAISLGGRTVGYFGMVDPRLMARFDVTGSAYYGELALERVPAYAMPRYLPPSRFPALARDLAIIVAPEVVAADVEAAVREAANSLCRDVRVFDEYRGPQVGEGKKSLAVRVVMQKADGTMTDGEADAAISTVLSALREKLDARIRE